MCWSIIHLSWVFRNTCFFKRMFCYMQNYLMSISKKTCLTPQPTTMDRTKHRCPTEIFFSLRWSRCCGWILLSASLHQHCWNILGSRSGSFVGRKGAEHMLKISILKFHPLFRGIFSHFDSYFSGWNHQLVLPNDSGTLYLSWIILLGGAPHLGATTESGAITIQ